MSLFEHKFDVLGLDEECRKYYETISRVSMRASDDPTVLLTLDVNNELYPAILSAKTLDIAIKTELFLEGATFRASDKVYNPKFAEAIGNSIINVNYVMNGTIFEFKQLDRGVAAYLSFGGLICEIVAPPEALKDFKFGQKVYLICSNTL